MAVAEARQIEQVRVETDEPGSAGNYSDERLGLLIDEMGVADTIVFIWRAKVAELSKMVDVSEGGSSRQNRQAFTNAMEMLKAAEARAITTAEATTRPQAAVHQILR